jgi:hypothetical protein
VKYHKWTPEELLFLVQNASKLPWKDIAEHLGVDERIARARYYFEMHKERPSWDGCPEIKITDYCPGCKYEVLCKRFVDGKI